MGLKALPVPAHSNVFTAFQPGRLRDIRAAKITFLAETIVVQKMSFRAPVSTFAVLIRGTLLDNVP